MASGETDPTHVAEHRPTLPVVQRTENSVYVTTSAAIKVTNGVDTGSTQTEIRNVMPHHHSVAKRGTRSYFLRHVLRNQSVNNRTTVLSDGGFSLQCPSSMWDLWRDK
jgi:pyrroline-5-carboxylate reductase